MTSSCAAAASSGPKAPIASSSEPTPIPQSRREKEIEATKKLLQNADDIVKEAEDSFLLNGYKPREYPAFHRGEIKFGPVLGVGGFGIVFEVKDISLTLPREVEILENSSGDDQQNNSTTISDHTEESPTHPPREEKDVSAAVGPEMGGVTFDNTAAVSSERNGRPRSDASQTTTATTYADAEPTSGLINSHKNSTGLGVGQDDSHYDVTNARQYMAEFVRRNGEARYAVKRLHRDLNDLERTRGMIDLAIEAKILSFVWHPNISRFCISAFPCFPP